MPFENAMGFMPLPFQGNAYRNFIDLLNHGAAVTHTPTLDRIETTAELLEVSAGSRIDLYREEIRKCERLTEIRRQYVNKQARFILHGIAKRTGRLEEFEKQFPEGTDVIDFEHSGAGDTFDELVEEYSLAKKNGEYLHDPRHPENLLGVDSSFVSGLLGESTSVRVLGEPDERLEDALIYDADSKLIRRTKEAHALEVGKTTATYLGYDTKKLDTVFSPLFDKDTREPNLPAMQKARMDVVKERMAALPEAERTEGAFIREWQNLDLVMKTYVFTKNRAEYCHERDMGVPEGKFRDLMAATVRHGSLIEEINGTYEAMFRNAIPGQIPDKKLEHFGAFVRHLKEAHSHRSLGARFVDWFRRDGTRRTVNRLVGQLRRLRAPEDKIRTLVLGPGDPNVSYHMLFDHGTVDSQLDAMYYNVDLAINPENYAQDAQPELATDEQTLDDVRPVLEAISVEKEVKIERIWEPNIEIVQKNDFVLVENNAPVSDPIQEKIGEEIKKEEEPVNVQENVPENGASELEQGYEKK